MSHHLPERKEKNCLNCEAQVQGRFCQVCGQENVETRETFWHLCSHFINDITHFDGKFFSTLKYLLFKPGYLSTEYVRGRRMRYLNPIRMYVFTSAIFFLIFFMQVQPDKITIGRANNEMVHTALQKQKKYLKEELDKKTMPAEKQALETKLLNVDKSARYYDSLMGIGKYVPIKGAPYNGKKLDTLNTDDDEEHIVLLGTETNQLPETVEAYDSIQHKLPMAQRNSWLQRILNRKSIELTEKYRYNKREFVQDLIYHFLHSFPKMLFLSLPLFAWILNLLYYRRKNFMFVHHGMFTIHLYCATFIILLVMILEKVVRAAVGVIPGFFDIVETLMILWIFFYEYKALHNFYQQGRAKTILKFIALNILSFLMILLLTIIFSVFTIWGV